jgi:hypothetical protein
MTVQVGAALGFLVIRRAGSTPGASTFFSRHRGYLQISDPFCALLVPQGPPAAQGASWSAPYPFADLPVPFVQSRASLTRIRPTIPGAVDRGTGLA